MDRGSLHAPGTMARGHGVEARGFIAKKGRRMQREEMTHA